ncbi:MAG: iron-containing redox enzyme family protein [Pseudomonadota bacterium]
MPSDTMTAKEYVKSLCDRAEQHRAVNHPYLKRLAKGDVPNIVGALQDLTYQYQAYSGDFLRYLTATISLMKDRDHRKDLLHNLTEETGQVSDEDAAALKDIGIEKEWIDGIAHPRLFMRFLDAIGIDDKYRKEHPLADETEIWRDMFYDLCAKGGAAQSLGAIGLGTENVVKFIYRPILEAIDKHLDVSKRDRVFFDLHAALDDEHGEVLTNIAIEHAKTEDNRRSLKEGMLMALSIRGAFFDAMETRAEAMTA